MWLKIIHGGFCAHACTSMHTCLVAEEVLAPSPKKTRLNASALMNILMTSSHQYFLLSCVSWFQPFIFLHFGSVGHYTDIVLRSWQGRICLVSVSTDSVIWPTSIQFLWVTHTYILCNKFKHKVRKLQNQMKSDIKQDLCMHWRDLIG